MLGGGGEYLSASTAHKHAPCPVPALTWQAGRDTGQGRLALRVENDRERWVRDGCAGEEAAASDGGWAPGRLVLTVQTGPREVLKLQVSKDRLEGGDFTLFVLAEQALRFLSGERVSQ